MLRRSFVLVLSLVVAVASGCTKASSEKVLHVASWSNYVTPDVAAAFQARTGIKVQVSNYSSNEELLAKLQAGASGYDLAFPSDYMVLVMTKLGLLQPIETGKIPGFKNLDKKWLGKSFDPKNEYSVPFDWGTTGIAYNSEAVKEPITSWKDLFERKDLAGKVTFLDDSRETIAAALKASGKSLNSKNAADLEIAKKLLMGARPRIKAFSSETQEPLVSGDFVAAHAYMTDALQARARTSGKIRYVIPKEGSTLWIDTMVIPKGAQNVEEARRFVDFMLDPTVASTLIQKIWVSPANALVPNLLPPNFKNEEGLFPKDAQLKNSEMLEDLGEGITAWDRVWTEIKAAG
ncbi:MAG: spermidine/putrescine ABC transporter substrate-binding protein [Bdellovibrionales bacterium]|nr:spermidine/putrescine ABC transporter substrate-binding protein [Bdellovibrionales bacterium]